MALRTEVYAAREFLIKLNERYKQGKLLINKYESDLDALLEVMNNSSKKDILNAGLTNEGLIPEDIKTELNNLKTEVGKLKDKFPIVIEV